MLLSPVPDGKVAALMFSYQNNKECWEAEQLLSVENEKKRKKDSTED